MKTTFSVLALIASVVATPIATTSTEITSLDTRAIEKRAYGPPPSTGVVCPQAQGFFYRGASGSDFQVACSINTSGGTLLAVYTNIPGIVGCAAQCDLWSVQVPSRKCVAATWWSDTKTSPDGVNNCFIRDGGVASEGFPNAVSAIRS
ncbi:hypothetical protein B0O99DRAFT_593465 [Bisporella sp. PMI_857]|nr:hypothetical protein B0O99DRAFT_593465 [Bisporella sp. PMI_857]